MSSYTLPNGDTFESYCDLIDVTSCHRADTGWRFVDAQGHEHRWYLGDKPAGAYDPSADYTTPTLIWVKDGEEWYEDDDEPHDVGHLECAQCGEHVHPGFTADRETRHIAGLRYYSINGESVSPDEFKRRWEEAQRG